MRVLYCKNRETHRKMTNLNTFDWTRCSHQWDAWWNGESDSPMFNIRILPEPGSAVPPKGYLSMYDFSIPPEQILKEEEAWLSAFSYPEGSYPSFWLNFGPGVLAAMLGGEGHNGMDTVWFTPGRWEGVPLEQMHFQLDRQSPWFQRIESICREADRLLKGRIHVGITDFGGALDILSTFLPGEALLFALYDAPDEVKRLTMEIHDAWFEAFDYFHSLLPANHGWSAWDGIFSSKPYYMLQCDFSYMISPEMFAEFVMPELSACCKRLERSFYHLDGKGELPHLPQLLAEERLGGIQWVPGAGNLPFTAWEEVYRTIADGGKKIWLAPGGDFDGASRIMDATGHPELFVLCDAVPPEREKELLRFKERYGAK